MILNALSMGIQEPVYYEFVAPVLRRIKGLALKRLLRRNPLDKVSTIFCRSLLCLGLQREKRKQSGTGEDRDMEAGRKAGETQTMHITITLCLL